MEKGPQLPLLYHTLHTRLADDLGFWLELAQVEGSPILELGCGTGRVLSYLASAGYQVFGLDNDFDMLSFLHTQWPGRSTEDSPARPGVFLADMACFHLGLRFPLILLPCNTFSLLAAGVRQEILACVHRHLAPNGLFAFSIPNPALLRRLPAVGESEEEDFFLHPATGNPVQVSSSWERANDLFTVYWHYDELMPDGQVERNTAVIAHTLTRIPEYQAALAEGGFTIDVSYGDFDKSPYRPRSPNWVVLARRI